MTTKNASLALVVKWVGVDSLRRSGCNGVVPMVRGWMESWRQAKEGWWLWINTKKVGRWLEHRNAKADWIVQILPNGEIW